jgi:hypothetical protein
MTTLFMLCAVIGGTVLVVQFVLTLLGMLDLGFDLDADLDVGDAGDVEGGGAEVGHAGHSGFFGLEWLWSMVSFRTVTAGMTFFGLFGMAMQSSGASPSLQFSTAMVAGLAAFYGVHVIMRGILKMAREGTMQIERAIGEVGTIYLTVPAANTGAGKVHVVVQGRLEEFQAITPYSDKLEAGAKVVVTGVVDGDTLAVEPVDAKAPSASKFIETVH